MSLAVLFLGLAIYFAFVSEEGLPATEKDIFLEKKTEIKTDPKTQEVLRSLLLRGQQWSGKISFSILKEKPQIPYLTNIVFAQQNNKKRYDFTINTGREESIVSVLKIDNNLYSCSQQICEKKTDKSLLRIAQFPLSLEQLSSVNVQKTKDKSIAEQKAYCFNIDEEINCWTENGALLYTEQTIESEGKIVLQAEKLETYVQPEFFNLPGRLE
ncbi:hypothetical protein HYV79_01355 [Candidatus Woesearchaeota archaeon]|nr:hypothetical protein [Candidatus Woesearchaeota archaeon]